MFLHQVFCHLPHPALLSDYFQCDVLFRTIKPLFIYLQLSQNKNVNRYAMSGMSGGKRNTSASHYHYTRGGGLVGTAAIGQPNSSHNDSDLAPPWSPQKYSASQQRHFSSMSTSWTERPKSQVITSSTFQAPPPAVTTGAAHAKTSQNTDQTKSNAQFASSQVGVSRTLSKPPGMEGGQKSKVVSE